jgi:flagellar biosynthesis/type III secretory pathway protein FliH
MSEREIEEREIDAAYDRGREDGYEAGFGEGHDLGHARGYESGLADGLEEALRRVNAWIRQGELSEPAHSERNGMVLAANLIREPQKRLS